MGLILAVCGKMFDSLLNKYRIVGIKAANAQLPHLYGLMSVKTGIVLNHAKIDECLALNQSN